MDLGNYYKISDYEWLIPKSGGQNVDILFIGNEKLLKSIDENILNKIKNVASLPGILEKVVVFPNYYLNEGNPVGITFVTDPNDGIICINGVGYDINCGIRLVTTNLIYQDIEKKVESLIKAFAKFIKSGEETSGKFALEEKAIRGIMLEGAKWVIEKRGFGRIEDLDYIEDKGVIEGADPDFIKDSIISNAKKQICTLGLGSHFLEIQIVDEIFDIEKARAFGIFKNQIVITFHTGSRSIGYNLVSYFSNLFSTTMDKQKIDKKDGLLYLPIKTKEAQLFLNAIKCASNFAFANRQYINYYINFVLNEVIKDVDINIMYDHSHNYIKEEYHKVGNNKVKVLVHRRGTTRNLAGKIPEVPKVYQFSGQPVILPGCIGNYSFVMAGREESIDKTFGSTVNGLGRSSYWYTNKEKVNISGEIKKLEENGIYLKYKDNEKIAEEFKENYKNIEEIVSSINNSGVSQRVARLKTLGILKG